MSDHHHDCPGLSWCGDHPRWHVVWLIDPPGWNVFKSDNDLIETFPAHTEAITHAQKAARE